MSAGSARVQQLEEALAASDTRLQQAQQEARQAQQEAQQAQRALQLAAQQVREWLPGAAWGGAWSAPCRLVACHDPSLGHAELMAS